MTLQNLLGNLALDATFQPITASGTITTQNLVPAGAATAGSAVAVTLSGRDTVAIQVTGTYTGALSIQGTVDGTTWVTMTGTNRIMNAVTEARSATIASATQGIFATSADSMTAIRVTALSAVTGTATVSLRAVDGNAMVALDTPLPAGSATIGAVTGSGNFATTMAASATGSPAKAEDAAHATGDVGVFTLSVRRDTMGTAQASAAGDYQEMATDINGAIWTRERTAPTSTLTNVASSATNVTILALNLNRRGATVYNDSTAVLYLKFGATASATSFTIKVQADGYYEVPFGYSGIIDGIWASANGSARVTEITV